MGYRSDSIAVSRDMGPLSPMKTIARWEFRPPKNINPPPSRDILPSPVPLSPCLLLRYNLRPPSIFNKIRPPRAATWPGATSPEKEKTNIQTKSKLEALKGGRAVEKACFCLLSAFSKVPS